MPRIRLAAVAVAVIALAACGKDATSPASTQLKADEAQALALGMAASGDAYSGAVAVPDVVTLSTTSGSTGFGPIAFTRAHPCPRGGTITPDVKLSGSIDGTARSLTLDVSGTETPKDCAYPVKAVTITVNGNPNLAITAHLAIVAGVPSGAQTFTEKGAFTWKSSDGRSGSCTVDVTSSADFAKNLRTVTGTFCDQTFNIRGPLH